MTLAQPIASAATFTADGKQVRCAGVHFADVCSPEGAALVVDRMNGPSRLRQLRRDMLATNLIANSELLDRLAEHVPDENANTRMTFTSMAKAMRAAAKELRNG